ncbi:hypothetical protein ACIOWM_29295 [Streptomyces anulatus]
MTVADRSIRLLLRVAPVEGGPGALARHQHGIEDAQKRMGQP